MNNLQDRIDDDEDFRKAGGVNIEEELKDIFYPYTCSNCGMKHGGEYCIRCGTKRKGKV